ncbi:hypothetical protein [Prosthecobacter sp.]|uniref:hypothetical protein n=1 Tax=Prosthecobacter sp. TaxID=1965333 RepID=UPI003783CE2B
MSTSSDDPRTPEETRRAAAVAWPGVRREPPAPQAEDEKVPDLPHAKCAGTGSQPHPQGPAAAGSEPPPRPPEYRAPSPVWHGITWHDVPGHDEPTQKLNFSLLRRGMLKGHQKCLKLEGEELKAELQKLSERNRSNSRKASLRRRGAPQPPRFPLPPPRFPTPPPRYPYPS